MLSDDEDVAAAVAVAVYAPCERLNLITLSLTVAGGSFIFAVYGAQSVYSNT